MENILSDSSVPVQENLPVTFIKAKFSKGRTKTGDPWAALDLIFKYDDFGNTKWLNHKLFQPSRDKFLDQQRFANFLADTLDTLSGRYLWDQIPKSKTSWEAFYESYLGVLEPYRNADCFIKTVCCPDYKDKSKLIACLSDNNFISLSHNLKYSTIEFNMVEEVVGQEAKFNFGGGTDKNFFEY